MGDACDDDIDENDDLETDTGEDADTPDQEQEPEAPLPDDAEDETDSSDRRPSRRLCGAFGMIGLPGMFLGLLAMRLRRR